MKPSNFSEVTRKTMRLLCSNKRNEEMKNNESGETEGTPGGIGENGVEIQECRSTRTWKRQIEENVRQITKQSTGAGKLTWQAGYGRRRASQIHHKTNTKAK
jgi:hypothetical protein